MVGKFLSGMFNILINPKSSIVVDLKNIITYRVPLLFVSFTQSSRHSKLEKADILEMTVRYLRNTQRRQISGKIGSHGGKKEYS